MTNNIPQHFKEIAELMKDDEAIFGLYYKVEDGQEYLGVSGGDWVDEESIDPIQSWAVKHHVEEYWEAEASDEFFIGEGYVKI